MSRVSIDQLRDVAIAETLSSEKGIVDLWYYFYDGIEADLLAEHEALLTPNARDGHRSFHLERD
jgi:hypothetical protein